MDIQTCFFFFYVIVLILKNDRRATITVIMLIGSCKPSLSPLNSCKNLPLKNPLVFIECQLKGTGKRIEKLNNGQKLKILCERSAKFFNRIPLLALMNNRTRQNDGRISLQKQTSNDKRQSSLTKPVINLLFVSEKVLLYDFE